MAAIYPLILSLLLTGCGGSVDDNDQITAGLDTGLTTTSTQTSTTTDTSNTETISTAPVVAPDYSIPGPFTPGVFTANATGSQGQSLYTEVWFPSTDAGSERVVYDTTYPGNAYTDVNPDCSEPRPVMMHSHGNGSIRWEMNYLPEHLASHGWVVVAADHQGNTSYEYTADFYDLIESRPLDIKDSFDWLLEASAASTGPMSGCIDADAGYIAMGYSFGGYTAYAVGGALVNAADGGDPRDLSDSRATAVITFAPWDAYGFLSDGTANIEIPALTIGGERDDTVGTQYQTLYDHLDITPRAMASYANVGHYSFVPMVCYYYGNIGNGCGSSYLDTDTMSADINTTVAAFAGHLRGEKGALEQLPEASSELVWDLVQ